MIAAAQLRLGCTFPEALRDMFCATDGGVDDPERHLDRVFILPPYTVCGIERAVDATLRMRALAATWPTLAGLPSNTIWRDDWVVLLDSQVAQRGVFDVQRGNVRLMNDDHKTHHVFADLSAFLEFTVEMYNSGGVRAQADGSLETDYNRLEVLLDTYARSESFP